MDPVIHGTWSVARRRLWTPASGPGDGEGVGVWILHLHTRQADGCAPATVVSGRGHPRTAGLRGPLQSPSHSFCWQW